MELAASMGEGAIRLAIFLVVLVVMALLEIAIPQRPLTQPKQRRWITNFAIAGIDALVVRLLAQLAVPIAAVAAAMAAQARGIGLFNVLGWPQALEVAVALVVLDGAIYLQHVASHKVPALWRLHRVHHADLDFDVTTALRFHPGEIALSMIYKVGLVFVLGPSALAVVIFEVVLNASAIFNHANVALPVPLDRALRALIVTPDMHRVHHSVLRREHDTNFGFNLAIWDRLFGSYTPAPEGGQKGMTIGLGAYRSEGPSRLGWSLMLPLRPLSEPDGTRAPADEPTQAQ